MPGGSNDNPTMAEVVFAVVFYSLCSSSMLVVNKMAMRALPVPALVSAIQLIICAVFIQLLGVFGVTKVDAITWSKVKPFSLFVLAFATGLYANMKALEASSVGTIIVFRACCPISVALVEYLFMDRMFPGPRSLLSLIIVVAGSYMYVSMDSEFQLNGLAAYFWVGVWYILICFQMAYGKALEGSVELTMWGRVLYTNLLSIPQTIFLGITLGDFNKAEMDAVKSLDFTQTQIVYLVLSSAIGIAIGYSGWLCRSVCSATSYTLVGVINKMLTIMLNVAFVENDASTESIVALVVCLIGGTLYKQAPLRSQAQRGGAKKAT